MTTTLRDRTATLGLVPAEYRRQRVDALKQAGHFAAEVGLPAVITHLGFIPENALDPEFAAVVEAVGEIAASLESQGLEL